MAEAAPGGCDEAQPSAALPWTDAPAVGRGWARTYVNACLVAQCRANSRLLRILLDLDRAAEDDPGTVPPPELDLAGAYVGRRGVEPLLRVVALWRGLRRLALRGNGLDSRAASLIADAALRHPSLAELDLSDNPSMLATAGAVLLRLARGNPRIVDIDIRGSGVPPGPAAKIAAALARSCAAAAPPPSPPPPPPPPPPAAPPSERYAGVWDDETLRMLRRAERDAGLRAELLRCVRQHGRVAVHWAMEWASPEEAAAWLRRLGPTSVDPSPAGAVAAVLGWHRTFAAEVAAQRPAVLVDQLEALRHLVDNGRSEGPRPKGQHRYATADAEVAALVAHLRRSFLSVAYATPRVSDVAAAAAARVEEWVAADCAGTRTLAYFCEQARYCILEHGQGMASHSRRWQQLGGVPNAADGDAEAVSWADAVDLFNLAWEDYCAAGAASVFRDPAARADEALRARRAAVALMRRTLPPAALDCVMDGALWGVLPNARVLVAAPPNPLAAELPHVPDASDVLCRAYAWGRGCLDAWAEGRLDRGVAGLAAWLHLQPPEALERYVDGARPATPPPPPQGLPYLNLIAGVGDGGCVGLRGIADPDACPPPADPDAHAAAP